MQVINIDYFLEVLLCPFDFKPLLGSSTVSQWSSLNLIVNHMEVYLVSDESWVCVYPKVPPHPTWKHIHHHCCSACFSWRLLCKEFPVYNLMNVRKTSTCAALQMKTTHSWNRGWCLLSKPKSEQWKQSAESSPNVHKEMLLKGTHLYTFAIIILWWFSSLPQ